MNIPNKFDCPILEFDPTREAIIEPANAISPIDIPEACVLLIHQETIDRLNEQKLITQIHALSTELGPRPIYTVELNKKYIALVNPGLGSSSSATIFEEVIALGCRKFIALGFAGVLYNHFKKGDLIIPDSAIRDEGTSYHYFPPSREISVETMVIEKIQNLLNRNGISYSTGKVWTTDAIYRETKTRRSRRKTEGCLAVDMECSALIAVAKYRGVTFGQILIADDFVGRDTWVRKESIDVVNLLQKYFWLSAEISLTL